MPRTAAKITQADIARAARALRAAGVERVRVVFRPEGVSVEPADRIEAPRERDAETADDEVVVVL